MRLSSEQIQRTAAARMLVREPELLVIDDRSSALDVATEVTFWRRIFAPSKACRIVSHCRTVIRAGGPDPRPGGRITARGTLAELLPMSAEPRRLSEPGEAAARAAVGWDAPTD